MTILSLFFNQSAFIPPLDLSDGKVSLTETKAFTGLIPSLSLSPEVKSGPQSLPDQCHPVLGFLINIV